MADKTQTRQVDAMGRVVIPKHLREQLALVDEPLLLKHQKNNRAVLVTKVTSRDVPEEHKVLDEQGRLLIPAELRHQYNWQQGEKIQVELDQDTIRLQGLHTRCSICGARESLLKIKDGFLCEPCLTTGNEKIAERWRLVLDELQNEYIEYCQKAVSFTDREDLHQARVKGRRLQMLLLFLGMKKDHKLLEKIQKAHRHLGKVRERDVLIEAFAKRAANEEKETHAAVFHQVKEIVDEKRRKEQRKLEKNLPQIINEKFERRWDAFISKELYRLVMPLEIENRIAEYEQTFTEAVTSYEEAAAEEGKTSKPALKALHEVRIQAKQLRYIYLYVSKIHSTVYESRAERYKQYQRQFGDINDIRDWLSKLKDSRKKIEAPAEEIKEVKDKLRAELEQSVSYIKW
ncbi:CHAD domain-containing protein [Salibacterium aidingense]|uniref:CHAD domain-containing protein n=1 Tax=Salibacterium aidingense TaxID=384933 RepID=UPI000414992E|nr:CHAD domain-containing protein [Salibacterium aidingense]